MFYQYLLNLEVCGYHLSRKLNQDNCVDYLEFGDLYKEQRLKDKALDFLLKNVVTVLKTEQWKGIEKRNPTLGLEVMKAYVLKSAT
jgi:speckle-type POZ protein